MKKVTIIISIAMVALMTGCKSSQLSAVSDEERDNISWGAFCDAHGYDRKDNNRLALNEYLDTWCGSADEETALINAGVEPF